MTTIVEVHPNSQRYGYTMDVNLATLLVRLIKVHRLESKTRLTIPAALEMLKPLVPCAVARVKHKRLVDETRFGLHGEGTVLFYDFGPREAENLT